MNLAQALISHDDYTYSWRDDIFPGPGLLLAQMERLPQWSRRPKICKRKPCETPRRLKFDPRAPANAELAERMLRVLIRAGDVGLTFSQVFERVGADSVNERGHSRYRTALRILLWMCEQQQVNKRGRHRTALFVANCK